MSFVFRFISVCHVLKCLHKIRRHFISLVSVKTASATIITWYRSRQNSLWALLVADAVQLRVTMSAISGHSHVYFCIFLEVMVPTFSEEKKTHSRQTHQNTANKVQQTMKIFVLQIKIYKKTTVLLTHVTKK